MTKILLTGGSGFIASHILEQLLEAGSHKIVTTVRGEDKAQKIRDAHPSQTADGSLVVLIVPDIAVPDAFDDVVRAHPDLEAVLHTASPFHFNFTDGRRELVAPAVAGTTGLLRALRDLTTPGSVRRVVVTSSFASILDEAKLEDPNTVYTEASWNPVTEAEVDRSKATAYRASKKLAEKAAWDFVAGKGDAGAKPPTFDLVTICPPLVLGPVVHHLASLQAINTSNERVVQLVRGAWRDAGAVPDTGAAYLWVDVRDVAAAHVRALDRPAAGGQRLLTTAGWFSNAEIARVIRDTIPEYSDRAPSADAPGGERPPADKLYGFDNTKTNDILGIQWRSLESSIQDLVKDLKRFGV